LVRKSLYKINCPVCVIHAKNDYTVPVENSYYIYRNVSSIEKRAFSFIIPNELSTNHVLTTHTLAKDRVFTYILQFIKDYEENFNLSPQTLLGFKGYVKHKYAKWKSVLKYKW
jgi:carboxylesterase